MRPAYEVGGILRTHWSWVFGNPHFSSHQKRILAALRDCRTPALGGHVDACLDCGAVRISYNSCRNRHCPKCQGQRTHQWIEARQQDLLPVAYFHVVFTLPACLNKYCAEYSAQVYNCLFTASWQTLKVFANDPKHLGTTTGATMVLHTWGQNLMLHPHVHCIVPAGGLSKSGRWKTVRSKGKYLFPVKAMSNVFRAKFIALARKIRLPIKAQDYKACFKKSWVVYAKRPFLGPRQVVEYLGRYTHKIAISNHRLLHTDQHIVRFRYKDYRQQGKQKVMSLSPHEFIRRFALHILPHRFVRIRHYGILASRFKQVHLEKIRQQIGENPTATQALKTEKEAKLSPLELPYRCPHCGGSMVIVEVLASARAPPNYPPAS